jgi:hypothetical protein
MGVTILRLAVYQDFEHACDHTKAASICGTMTDLI